MSPFAIAEMLGCSRRQHESEGVILHGGLLLVRPTLLGVRNAVLLSEDEALRIPVLKEEI